jgi:photosystem II stability/assembly factor-like uncharacterized protein
MSFRSLILLPLASLVLLGAGCSSSVPAVLDGGVFRTRNDASVWEQLKVLDLNTRVASAEKMGTVSIGIDPQDQDAVYVGTQENGLMYSMDGGVSWRIMKGMSQGKVNAVLVDAKDKCTVYVARLNQVFKTVNCGRDWLEMYSQPAGNTTPVITSLVGDWFNTLVLFAGTNEGDVLRSDDGGAHWRAINRVEGTRINGIVIDPRDSRILYVATNGAGIQKTIDGGTTWITISKEFQEFSYARTVKMLVLDPNTANRVYAVSKYGILKSEDGGAIWKALTLPSAPQSVDITAFTVNPKNPNVIVYATKSVLVYSADAGVTWASKKLPTKRGVAWLQFDKAVTQSLYLGSMPAAK